VKLSKHLYQRYPIPSPPSVRAAVRSPLEEQIEDPWQDVLGHADSFILDDEDAAVPSPRTRTRIARPTGVNFTALIRTLRWICSRRIGSTLTPTGSASTVTAEEAGACRGPGPAGRRASRARQ
jgi:hypothetical protein